MTPLGTQQIDSLNDERRILTADRIVTPDQLFQPGFVEVIGTRLGQVGAGKPPPGPEVVQLPEGSTLLPGLVDMHVHGAGGGNMTALDVEELHRAAAALIAVGVTSTVASLVTAPLNELEQAVDLIAGLVQNPPQGVARIVGSHLEGPFLSPAHRGCHDQGSLCLPDVAPTRRLLRAGRGTVRMMTLAPELPGARDVLELLTAEGVVGAMGHTGATYAETRDAISWGVRVGTHLFNGMVSPHHREPGPSLTLLDDPRVTVELINDGVHVHPAVARIVSRAAHDGRLAMISDGVAATGAPDGDYMLGHVTIRSQNGQVVSGDGTSLGGGVVTLDGALRRAVQVLGMPLELAVAAVTAVPARALGVADVAGSLAPGRTADICVMDADLNPVAVMLAGRWIIEPSSQIAAEHRSRSTT